MNQVLRKLLLVFGVILLLFAGLLIMMHLEIFASPMLNLSFRYSDRQIERKFTMAPFSPEVRHLPYNGKTLRYLLLEHDRDKPYVVFIHGAPGSCTDYIRFFHDERLHRHFNILSIDRPGYGYSDFGNSETSIYKQAEAMTAVVQTVCHENQVLLVGHSYGGPIVLSMAANFRFSVAKILLLAPAIDPSNEKKVGVARLGVQRGTRWLTPPALRVAADEKTTHIQALLELQPQLANVKTPIYHMHGTRDSLVPYTNVSFSENTFSKEQLTIHTLQDVDHFLPWTHYDLVVETLVSMAGKSDGGDSAAVE
jgi:pimeloyl-ACP methyl ester carboxylesterase